MEAVTKTVKKPKYRYLTVKSEGKTRRVKFPADFPIEQFKRDIEYQTRAWADVPDPVAWVRNLRDN
ncbi:hypothetical protein FACS1894103_6800 [Campylobacterota bacterium]|nr:hypothetical protein FACS1894103_6800 [Campylobacterota bacterium]